MRRLRRAMAGFLLLITLAPSAAEAAGEPERAFCDVPAGSYYETAVAWAKGAGITSGVSSTAFDGDGPTTRAQLVTLLQRYVVWRDGGLPATTTSHDFVDVEPGSFYAAPVQWARAAGITTGIGGGRFDPHSPTTRAQLAAFVHRLAGAPSGGAAPFSDLAPGAWYAEAVAWLASTGLTTGTAPDVYSPDAVSTRGQVITFLWRLAGEPAPGPFEPARCPRTFTAVGDSVMGGTRVDHHLLRDTFPGWVGTIDARGCRQPLDDAPGPSICGQGTILSALSVLRAARDAGTLGEVVIVHSGTNGPFSASTFDLMMEATAGADTVWFVTINTPWRRSEETNAVLRDGIARWSDTRDVRLLDWWARSTASPELLDPVDRFHLTHLGRVAFTEMIGDALAAS